jgi:uncharacterized protein with HEPN domain
MFEIRTHEIYIFGILSSIEKIESYITDISFEQFLKDEKTQDAVLRNLEIIGEASRRIDSNTQEQMPDMALSEFPVITLTYYDNH